MFTIEYHRAGTWREHTVTNHLIKLDPKYTQSLRHSVRILSSLVRLAGPSWLVVCLHPSQGSATDCQCPPPSFISLRPCPAANAQLRGRAQRKSICMTIPATLRQPAQDVHQKAAPHAARNHCRSDQPLDIDNANAQASLEQHRARSWPISRQVCQAEWLSWR
jgi:hypothetical protein